MSIKAVKALGLVRITEELPGERNSALLHLSSPVQDELTLCGWVDATNEGVSVGEPSCPECLAVVAAVREYLQRPIGSHARKRAVKPNTRRGEHHGPE